jgi:hypothetical protein
VGRSLSLSHTHFNITTIIYSNTIILLIFSKNYSELLPCLPPIPNSSPDKTRSSKVPWEPEDTRKWLWANPTPAEGTQKGVPVRSALLSPSFTFLH